MFNFKVKEFLLKNKYFKKEYFLLISLLIISESSYSRGARPPKLLPVEKNPPIENPNAPKNPLPPTQYGLYVDQVRELARNSNCAKYSFKNRGRAPAGYISGLAVTYAKSFCRLKQSSKLSQSVMSQMAKLATKDSRKDALAHYASSFDQFNLNLNSSGAIPLHAIYTLGMGLGMRETSGKYCEGWDRSAGADRTSKEAEAGLFQTSLDSLPITKELDLLYSHYKSHPEKCFLDIFQEGVKCNSLSNLGTGKEGLEYQKFNKACPAFATEYAMIMLRVARTHYGPINRKEAEVVPACFSLLSKVSEIIENDPQNSCEQFLEN